MAVLDTAGGVTVVQASGSAQTILLPIGGANAGTLAHASIGVAL